MAMNRPFSDTAFQGSNTGIPRPETKQTEQWTEEKLKVEVMGKVNEFRWAYLKLLDKREPGPEDIIILQRNIIDQIHELYKSATYLIGNEELRGLSTFESDGSISRCSMVSLEEVRELGFKSTQEWKK